MHFTCCNALAIYSLVCSNSVKIKWVRKESILNMCCRKLIFLMLEEFERLTFDQFIISCKNKIKDKIENMNHERLFSIELVRLRNDFVAQQSSHRCNDCIKHARNFIMLSSEF